MLHLGNGQISQNVRKDSKKEKKYLAANLCLTKLLTVNIETKGNHTLLESEVNSKRELTEYLKALGATSILPIVITF